MIGLVQVDGKLPNHALMRICGYFEDRGETVEWYKGPLFQNEYSFVYASKIFQFSRMPELPVHSMLGGTGINFFNKLPPEFEDAKPSYSLYPKCNFHIGFSMKGCRFRCKFCCVPVKEGRPHFNSTIADILTNPVGGNRLMLLDNDFFGIDEWRTNLEKIIELNLKVCFAQGLNIRIITDEQAELLAQCRYDNSHFNQRYLSFAWDIYRDGDRVFAGIERCVRAGIPTNHMQFFVLIGFDTTPEQDLERVTRLRDAGCFPYVMPYNRSDSNSR